MDILRLLWSFYKWRIVVFLMMLFIVNILDVVSVVLVIPLLLNQVGSGSYEINFLRTFSALNIERFSNYEIFFIILTLFLLKGALYVLLSTKSTSYRLSFITSSRNKLLDSVAYRIMMDPSFSNGRAMYLLNENLLNANQAIILSTLVLNSVATALVASILLFQTSSILFIVSIVFLLINFPFQYIIGKINRRFSEFLNAQRIDANGIIIYILNNLRYLILTNSIKNEFTHFKRVTYGLLKEEVLHSRRTSTMKVIKELLGLLMIFLVIYMLKNDIVDVSDVLVGLVLMYKFFDGSVQARLEYNNTLVYSKDYMDLKESLKKAHEGSRSVNILRWEEKLELIDVTVCFDDRETILNRLNLEIEYGQFVLIKGQSGSGKSTLLQIIACQQIYTDGKVIVDKRLLDKSKFYKLDGLGYVPQEVYFKQGTLFDLLTEGRPVELSNIEELINELGLSEFLKSLPNGLNTFIADNGSNLSGGQKQRLLLLRELLKKPRILFLDECTSALDRRSEDLVVSCLKRNKSNITIIAISHNNKLDLLADRIITLGK